jgi:predicted kinase
MRRSRSRKGTLILVCGLPGAGKTTVAKRLEAERGAIRMCPDEWIESLLAHRCDFAERDRLRDPVENLQWDLVQGYLAQGLTVVLENGFWSEEERSLYAIGAIEVGASIELVSLEAPLEELWRRIAARNEELPNETWLMTREELARAWAAFEPPSDEELAWYDEGTRIAAEAAC